MTDDQSARLCCQHVPGQTDGQTDRLMDGRTQDHNIHLATVCVEARGCEQLAQSRYAVLLLSVRSLRLCCQDVRRGRQGIRRHAVLARNHSHSGPLSLLPSLDVRRGRQGIRRHAVLARNHSHSGPLSLLPSLDSRRGRQGIRRQCDRYNQRLSVCIHSK